MADTVDLVKTDPNELNSHVKVAFEDVFGEPDGTHSIDCIWQIGYACFIARTNCCYKLMTTVTVCGLCIALWWGFQLAEITFEHVWFVTPYLRCFSIYAGCCQKFIGIGVQSCLVPICETCGLMFSKVSISRN